MRLLLAAAPAMLNVPASAGDRPNVAQGVRSGLAGSPRVFVQSAQHADVRIG